MTKLGSLGKVLIVKGGFLIGLYAGYAYHHDIKIAEYNVVSKNQPVQEKFFSYSPSLALENETNSEGRIETYLKAKDFGTDLKKVGVFEDLHAPTQDQLENLETRIEKKFDDAHLKFDKYFELFKKAYNSVNEEKIPDYVTSEKIITYFQADLSKKEVGMLDTAKIDEEKMYQAMLTDKKQYIDSIVVKLFN